MTTVTTEYEVGEELTFTVGDGNKKQIKCTVVSKGRWYYSGHDYIVLSFSPCMGCKGFIRIDLNKNTDLNLAVKGFFDNRFTIVKYCSDPEKFSDQVRKRANWGGGWEWAESKHPSQDGYGCEVSFGSLRIQNLYENHIPSDVGYFAKTLSQLPFVGD